MSWMEGIMGCIWRYHKFKQQALPSGKFHYLKSKLDGEADRCIARIAVSADNYQTAIELLQKRFGNLQCEINMHYTRLMDKSALENSPQVIAFLSG